MLACVERKVLPPLFSPRGEPLSKEERNGESGGIFRDTRIMHTFQECPFVRGDASLLVRLPRCSFHSLCFSSLFEESGSIFSRFGVELGIKMDYCRLENSSKDRFHSKDASWNWIKWNKNRLLSSPSRGGKDPIFSRITIIVRTMLTTAVLADLIFHPRNARNCFLPLYRIYVILLQLTKNTDSPPLF